MAAKHPDRPSSRYQLLAAGSYSAGTTVELLATRTRTPKYELQPMPEFSQRTRKPGGGPKRKTQVGNFDTQNTTSCTSNLLAIEPGSFGHLKLA